MNVELNETYWKVSTDLGRVFRALLTKKFRNRIGQRMTELKEVGSGYLLQLPTNNNHNI